MESILFNPMTDSSIASITANRYDGRELEFGAMLYLHRVNRIPQMWLHIYREGTVTFSFSFYRP